MQIIQPIDLFKFKSNVCFIDDLSINCSEFQHYFVNKKIHSKTAENIFASILSCEHCSENENNVLLYHYETNPVKEFQYVMLQHRKNDQSILI